MVEFPEMGDGSCINCGLLAWTARAEDPSGAREATRDMRGYAKFPGGWATCFVGSSYLSREMGELEQAGVAGEERLRKVLEAGRNCRDWLPWRPGFDARWHVEDQRLAHIEAARREWQERLEADRRAWEDRVEENRRLWDQKLEADRKAWEIQSSDQAQAWQRGFRRETRWWQVLALAVAVVAVLVAVRVG